MPICTKRIQHNNCVSAIVDQPISEFLGDGGGVVVTCKGCRIKNKEYRNNMYKRKKARPATNKIVHTEGFDKPPENPAWDKKPAPDWVKRVQREGLK